MIPCRNLWTKVLGTIFGRRMRRWEVNSRKDSGEMGFENWSE
jgi:hypothetical protein